MADIDPPKEKKRSVLSEADYARYQERTRAKKRRENPFDVELFYPSFSAFTFKTIFEPLPIEEAKAIITWYQANFLNRIPETDDHLRITAEIAAKLDARINQLPGGCAFVRLSTRSPKDSSLEGEDAMISDLADKLERLGEGATLNDRLVALMSAFGADLKVFSGKQAMTLLLHSERVYTDLLAAVEMPPSEYRMNYILREWVDLPVGMEFRCFVYNGKLTAITQYDHIVYYKFVHDKKSEIEARMKAYFEQELAPKLVGDYLHAVVDTVVFPDKIMVIELNPFNNYDGAGTGGSLFRWNGPDRDVLEGKAPFEFRILTAPQEELQRRVFPDWAALIDKALVLSQTRKPQSSCSIC